MATRSRMRPAHWIVLVLALARLEACRTDRTPRSQGGSPEAVAEGRVLFNHEWTAGDPLTKGDGLGPVFNATSCVDCHSQGGPGGGGPISKNVVVYGLTGENKKGVPSSGVIHQKAVRQEFQETLNLVHAALPRKSTIPLAELLDRSTPRPTDIVVTQRNTPALFRRRPD